MVGLGIKKNPVKFTEIKVRFYHNLAKKRKKDDLQVSLFPFLSILACVLGILTLMITAVVLSQANNESFQEKVAEAMSDETEFQEKLQREKDELTRLRKELEEVRKQPNKVVDPNKKNKLEHSRIGVAIRKKDIKLSVNRNRIKRKIKGSFRSKLLELQKKDYVVLVKKNLSKEEKQLTRDLDFLWGKFKK